MSIPTMVVVRDGVEVDRVVGALPGRQLEARLARHIVAPAGEGAA
jgi:thioredoxin-like negative regulator of GroEL